MESPRLIAGLVRLVHDVQQAEDLAADALVAALERWPVEGVPKNPGAWLMNTAKRRGIDHLRAKVRHAEKHEVLGRELDARQEDEEADRDEALDDAFGDDLLKLVFMTCHPVL